MPDDFKLPANVHAAEPTSITYEKFGEDEFYVKSAKGQDDQAVTKTGQHWGGGMVVDNRTETEGKKIFATAVKPSRLKAGWSITSEYDSNPFSVMMRSQKNGNDAWMYLKIFGADDLRLHLVETAGPTAVFKLPEPEAKPETVSADSGDFPYLLPLPGSAFGSSSPDSRGDADAPPRSLRRSNRRSQHDSKVLQASPKPLDSSVHHGLHRRLETSWMDGAL